MDPELADPRPDIQWTTAHLPQFVPATASVPARGVSKRCAELAMTCSDLTGELLTAVSLPRHGRHAVYAIAVRRAARTVVTTRPHAAPGSGAQRRGW